MNRALALLAVAWLVVLAAIFTRAAIDPDPVPFAAEDENGTVYLWPGAMPAGGDWCDVRPERPCRPRGKYDYIPGAKPEDMGIS